LTHVVRNDYYITLSTVVQCIGVTWREQISLQYFLYLRIPFWILSLKWGNNKIEIFSKRFVGWGKDRIKINLRFTGGRIEASESPVYKRRHRKSPQLLLAKLLLWHSIICSCYLLLVYLTTLSTALLIQHQTILRIY